MLSNTLLVVVLLLTILYNNQFIVLAYRAERGCLKVTLSVESGIRRSAARCGINELELFQPEFAHGDLGF